MMDDRRELYYWVSQVEPRVKQHDRARPGEKQVLVFSVDQGLGMDEGIEDERRREREECKRRKRRMRASHAG